MLLALADLIGRDTCSCPELVVFFKCWCSGEVEDALGELELTRVGVLYREVSPVEARPNVIK